MASRALRAESAQSNVVRLPTAAPRKVIQPNAMVARDFRKAHPWPTYEHHFRRRCKSLAETLTPAELMALAVMVTLPEDQRKAAAAQLTRLWFCSDHPDALRAAEIAGMALAGSMPA